MSFLRLFSRDLIATDLKVLRTATRSKYFSESDLTYPILAYVPAKIVSSPGSFNHCNSPPSEKDFHVSSASESPTYAISSLSPPMPPKPNYCENASELVA